MLWLLTLVGGGWNNWVLWWALQLPRWTYCLSHWYFLSSRQLPIQNSILPPLFTTWSLLYSQPLRRNPLPIFKWSSVYNVTETTQIHINPATSNTAEVWYPLVVMSLLTPGGGGGGGKTSQGALLGTATSLDLFQFVKDLLPWDREHIYNVAYLMHVPKFDESEPTGYSDCRRLDNHTAAVITGEHFYLGK